MKNFESGTYIQHDFYKSFLPTKLSREWKIDDMELSKLLSDADREIGKLDMFSSHIPDIDMFIRLQVTREATDSSKIEGTQTHFDEAIKEAEDIPEERRDDWQEVQNYISAINYGIERLSTLPISSRLIQETHRYLLKGVRGKYKNPGEFRRSQNWIGGASISDAAFVPPHQDDLPDLMTDLEKFIHCNNLIPELVKIALIHYQFETIHPFLDGNGRIGRLLIPLYLTNKGVIQRPILYMSAFFEKNRRVYYDKLSNVRINNDIVGWVKFFLVGVIETAKNSINTFNKILDLKEAVSEKLQKLGKRSASATTIVKYLYGSPLIKIKKIMEILNVSHGTAYSLVKELCEIGILVKLPRIATKDRYYVFKDYLNIFSERADDR